jgi:Tfp pilus assembly PilM family ATPase
MFSIFSKTKILVGLEISSNYIRFVELKRSIYFDEILSHGETFFQNIISENGDIIDAGYLLKILKDIKKDISAKNFIVSLPASAKADPYLDLLKNAGIKVRKIETVDNALSKSLVPKGSNTSFLIVNAEKSFSDFLICDGARKAFFYHGSSENYSIIKNIDKIYIDWYDEHKEKIHNIVFTGSRVTDRNFLEYIGRETKIPINLANVFINLQLDDNKIPTISKEDSYKYAVSIGLSMS